MLVKALSKVTAPTLPPLSTCAVGTNPPLAEAKLKLPDPSVFKKYC